MAASATKTATDAATKSKTKTRKVSPAQIEANRRNAKKSCGPKSDEGKSRSPFNALKHGKTAQTVLFPGDDGKAFQGRLRYLQDDLQPRNSLEGVAIERLAGDLWKADRAELAAGARINFRLRHGLVNRQRKDREQAIKLGQHLLYKPTFPLPVGAEEGGAKAKGALGKFPLADVPGDPNHPARLLLKLEATVAGCDWLLKCWRDLRFRLEIPGQWVMNNVWTLVRLLGKTALEVKDDYQVALLVLASMALLPEPEPKPEPGQQPSFAEAMSAMNRDERLSRIAAGITRLCEPFQEALARMPLDKLAPANDNEARQRLAAVVEQELGRIDGIRAMLQQIAGADEAEAPVRLAFETGTEGDRGRRYVLSYERLINRRIDTFLKVRKASGSGELDLVELQKLVDADELVELTAAAGVTISTVTGDLLPGDQCTGDLRSEGGRGRETRAQHAERRGQDREPSPQQSEANLCSVRVSDPTETDDRRSPGLGVTLDGATSRDEQGVTKTCRRDHAQHEQPSLDAGDLRSGVSAGSETLAEHAETQYDRELSAVSFVSEMCCDDQTILRNEANNALDERRALENIDSAGPAVSLEVESGGKDEHSLDNLDSEPKHVIVPADADELNPPLGDKPVVPTTAVPTRLTAAALSKLLVPMDKAALDLLSAAEIKARRWAMYVAKRLAEGTQIPTVQPNEERIE